MMQKDKEIDIEEQLRQAIEKSELSSYQISKLAGISESQFSLFLNRKRTLTLSSAAKIACILGLELNKKRYHKKKEVFMMSGRKKPEAEIIQLKISQILNRLKREKILTENDHKSLWDWTHQLYEIALGSSE